MKIILLVIAIALIAVDAFPQTRSLTIDDILNNQAIHEVIPSGDGSLLITIQRNFQDGSYYGTDNIGSMDLYLFKGGRLIKVEAGNQPEIGTWGGRWSPLEDKFAYMYDSMGLCFLKVYDLKKGHSYLLSKKALDMEFNAGAIDRVHRVAFHWINDSTILTVFKNPQLLTRNYTLRQFEKIADSLVTKTRLGKEPSTRIWQSTALDPSVDRPESALVLVDAEKKTEQLLSKGFFLGASFSAGDKACLVIKAEERLQPEQWKFFELWPRENYYTNYLFRYSFEVMDFTEAAFNIKRFPATMQPIFTNAQSFPKWLSDTKFIYSGYKLNGSNVESGLFLTDIKKSTTTSMYLARGLIDNIILDQDRVLFHSDSVWQNLSLAVRAPSVHTLPASPSAAATDLVGRPSVFSFKKPDGTMLYFLQGKLYRLNERADRFEPIVRSDSFKIERLLYPDLGKALNSGNLVSDEILYQTKEGIFLENLNTHSRTRKGSVEGLKITSAYFAARGAPFYIQTYSHDGLQLQKCSSDRLEPVLRLNTHLANINKYAQKIFPVPSANKTILKSLLLYPINFDSTKKYPLIVNIYPVGRYDTLDVDKVLNQNFILQRLLFLEKGYCVLIPSIPIWPDTARNEPYTEVWNYLKPQMQFVKTLPFIDSARLAIYGHSYGGFSTIAVISQTNDFKTAISSAALSNYGDYHSAVFPHYRYDNWSFSQHLWAGKFELENRTMFMRMKENVVPYYSRYIQNSPFFHLDKINTPLLLLHGDMDGFSIRQDEALFTEMDRLGKKVKLVNYWGEYHIPDSPANGRDFWQQIFSWLKTCGITPENEQ